jgi:hypothetical protein
MVGLHLLTGALLLAAQPAAEPRARPPAQPPSIAGFASFFQQGLPQDFDGYKLVSARAEGNLLVFTADGSRGWRRRKDNATLTREIMAGFCGPEGNFLTGLSGTGLRVDTLEEGQNLERGVASNDCPPEQRR